MGRGRRGRSGGASAGSAAPSGEVGAVAVHSYELVLTLGAHRTQPLTQVHTHAALTVSVKVL